MMSTGLKKIATAAIALLIFGFAAAAHAQYVWLDENGTKQFSDQPPPSSVPKNRILKAPIASLPDLRPQFPGDAPVPAAASRTLPATTKMPLTTADKNAEYNKRKIEQAEKEKKAAGDVKVASDKVQNCERARSYKRDLESGQRIVRTNDKGERNYLSDAERVRETNDAKANLNDCK